MIELQELTKEEHTMSSIMKLTGAFEGIASMHVARIKDKVLISEKFFADLWPIYTQIRVSKEFNMNRHRTEQVQNKDLFIIITSEGSLSGDIDHRVIRTALQDYDPKQQEIIVFGHHGSSQLTQLGIDFAASYRLPSEDQQINFDSIVKLVRSYRSTAVYYQSYITLMNQEIKKITLTQAVQELLDKADNTESVISDTTYIFEPSLEAIVDFMEESMLHIVLGQVTLSSRLAQHASRFKAMSSAHTMAKDAKDDLQLQLNRAKRFIKDQRIRETINGSKREDLI